MLTIRFNRTGKRNRAYYRVVLQEHTKAPGKRHVEILGSYDPHKKTTILQKDRILHWIGQGAQTSDVVHNLLVREGVLESKKIAKKMPRPVVKEEPKAEVPVAEATPVEPIAEVTSTEAPAQAESAPAEEGQTETPAPEVPVEKKEETVIVEEPKA